MSIITGKALGGFLAAGVLASGAAVSGDGHGIVDALAGSSGSSSGTTACQRIWDRLPSALQDDLQAAHGLPDGQRLRAYRTVRRDALTGQYGVRVQEGARLLRDRRTVLRDEAPERLKADVRAARRLPAGQRYDALVAIRHRALHGGYGRRVEDRAQARQRFRQGCSGVLQGS
jgi:hypothetical protein